MWSEAQLWWHARQQAATVTPSAPNPGAPMATTSTPSSTTTATASDKVPKVLPPQVWTQLVNAYNQVTLAGKPRKFPGVDCATRPSTWARS